jgi:hypothetical protein
MKRSTPKTFWEAYFNPKRFGGQAYLLYATNVAAKDMRDLVSFFPSRLSVSIQVIIE